MLSSFSFQLRAHNDIKAGDQITICYVGLSDNRPARREELLRKYNFTCQCPACALPDDKSKASDIARTVIEKSPTQLKPLTDAWLKDRERKLPDHLVIEQSKAVVDLIERWNIRNVTPWLNALNNVCVSYLALGDAENAKVWAARCIRVTLANGGTESPWAGWVKNPEKAPFWRMRLK